MYEVRQLFEKALGLVQPWKITRSEFDPKAKRLDLHPPPHRRGEGHGGLLRGRSRRGRRDQPQARPPLRLALLRPGALQAPLRHERQGCRHVRALQGGPRRPRRRPRAAPRAVHGHEPRVHLRVAKHFPHVPVTFDRYHLEQDLNFALWTRSAERSRSTARPSRRAATCG